MIWASLEEQSILTSASKTILLPSGQMTWSTRGLTCTHFRSKDRRPAWDIGIYSLTPNHSHIEAYTRTHNMCLYQIYLTARVSHVADYAAILHFVQMFSHHNIFNPCREAVSKKKTKNRWKKKLIENNILIVLFKKKSINHRMTAVTCAGDDHVYMSDYFTQFNYSEAIHAEWSGG